MHSRPQAACTPKELKELATLDASIAVHAAAEQMAVSDDDRREMASVRLKRRIHEIITKASAEVHRALADVWFRACGVQEAPMRGAVRGAAQEPG